MPDYLEYQKSVSREFKAYESRVRNLIDGANWAEEGRYKEIILMNYLKRILPKNLSVGTGFVRNMDKITKQIDIIIYDNSFPVLFSEGDFIITTSQNVVGIIEVKSKIRPSELSSIIEKTNYNGEIIAGNKRFSLFNGIFSFNSEGNVTRYINELHNMDFSSIVNRQHFNEPYSDRLLSCVNHITLGDRVFIKLWPYFYKSEFVRETKYSIYEFNEELSFPYFLSNLQEIITRKQISGFIEELPQELKSFYYPIEDGKEVYLVNEVVL